MAKLLNKKDFPAANDNFCYMEYSYLTGQIYIAPYWRFWGRSSYKSITAFSLVT